MWKVIVLSAAIMIVCCGCSQRFRGDVCNALDAGYPPGPALRYAVFRSWGLISTPIPPPLQPDDSDSGMISRGMSAGRSGSMVSAPTAGGQLQVTPNTYGLGVGSDQYGRPVRYQSSDGTSDPLLRVKPDTYGPGIGQDQYGRPTTAVPAY